MKKMKLINKIIDEIANEFINVSKIKKNKEKNFSSFSKLIFAWFNGNNINNNKKKIKEK